MNNVSSYEETLLERSVGRGHSRISGRSDSVLTDAADREEEATDDDGVPPFLRSRHPVFMRSHRFWRCAALAIANSLFVGLLSAVMLAPIFPLC
jgi:hypothetical protein